MGKSPSSYDALSGRIGFNGSILQEVNLGTADAGVANANNGKVVAQCSGEIVHILLVNSTISGDDTNVLINIGTNLDNDSIVKDFDLNIDAASVSEIPLDAATVVDLTVVKGDFIEFDLEATTGGTTATSDAVIGLVLIIDPNVAS